jgi:allophanate hydrolase
VPSSLRPDGLPFGITLVGLAGSDWQLAELGQRYHHATGLPQGALNEALPAPVALPGIRPAATVRLAVVGAHLSGMPLNSQLTTRGATLVGPARTAPDYRFYALPGTVPPKPGCCAWRRTKARASRWKSGRCRCSTTAPSWR